MTSQLSLDMHKAVKQLAEIMVSLRDHEAKTERGLALFMGLGIALGVCWEAVHGQPYGRRTPQQILQWAIDLPEVPKEVLQ